MQKYNLEKKKSSKRRNQNLSRYHNSIPNLQFQPEHKISSFRNPHIKIDLLPRRPKSLKLVLLYVLNLNTISLPWVAKGQQTWKLMQSVNPATQPKFQKDVNLILATQKNGSKMYSSMFLYYAFFNFWGK
jgi:hypothetical protein